MVNYAGSSESTDLTQRLRRYGEGDRDRDGADTLLRDILPELHQIAARELQKERGGSSLTPTDLIDETWLRSLRKGGWNISSRGHFYALAAKAMRRVLVDLARRRLAQRRRPEQFSCDLEQATSVGSSLDPGEIIAFDLLMEQLEKTMPKAASVVDLHYIAGYTHEEVAERTGLTLKQVRYLWRKGSDWLKDRI